MFKKAKRQDEDTAGARSIRLRHEYKHQITYEDYLIISKRLKLIGGKDIHANQSGRYYIHSLYFDNMHDKALREKLDGVNLREKFRIRYYNENTNYIKLEKKSKIYGLCEKRSVSITKNQCMDICEGRIQWLLDSEEVLLQELYAKMKYQQLKPKTIVEYIREPYVYTPGNVRVTFDTQIRTGLYCTDMLSAGRKTIETQPGLIVMEVKYDDFLPQVILDAIQTNTRKTMAFSKYAACRMYG